MNYKEEQIANTEYIAYNENMSKKRYSKHKYKKISKKKAAVISIIWVLFLIAYGLMSGQMDQAWNLSEYGKAGWENIDSQVKQDGYHSGITFNASGDLKVHFIDVGQGDATLITCDNKALLIDAGDNSKGTTVQMYLQKQGIKKLDYLILTHPDADHIGGADVVVTKFDVDTVFMADFKKDNKTYDDLIRALKGKNLKWSTPNVGNTYRLGSAEFTIIAPNTIYDDPNNASIGLLLTYGDTSFLFTGDAEEEAEYDILANSLNIECDVFKAGHHGSSTSNSKDFVEAASPEYVVVSCEKDNSYGHPHAEPMNLFRSMGVKLFRTDEQGSIIAASDGSKITWNCAPVDDWTAGEKHN